MLPIAIGKIILEVAGPAIAKRLGEKLANDPAAKNQMNMEPVTKSRVVIGSSMAFLPALFYCLYAVLVYRFEFGRYVSDPVLVIAVPAAAGGFISLYGRLKGGLKPLGDK